VKHSFAVLFLLCGSLIACNQQDGPSLAVNNVQIFAPLPGSSVSVAYFSIVNNTDKDSRLVSIGSRQYGRVAMHDTIETEGVARMRPSGTVIVPANGEVDFSPGGLHVMLMDPLDKLDPGSPITMQFQFQDNLLVVSTTLQTRRPTN